MGLFGFYEHIKGYRDSGLAISVRGMLGWSALLMVLAWFAGAGAIYTIWQRKPYNLLTYADALSYPLRRHEISAKHGQEFIAEGTALWKNKRYQDAVFLLRQGLARCPGDRPARTLLAQFYLFTNRWPQALDTLQDGIGGTYPDREYLQAVFSLAERGEDFPTVVRLCQQLRARVPAERKSRDEPWLAARQFDALLAAGRSPEALVLSEAEPPGDRATEHRVLALLALKRPDDAATFLAGLGPEVRGNRELIARLEVRVYREAKRFEDMERALAAHHDLAPAGPDSFVYRVVQQALAQRPQAALHALDDYLFRFGSSPADILRVAQPLAELGSLSLVERCVAAASERGYPNGAFEALRLEVALRQGEWTIAAQALQATAAGAGTNAQGEQKQREWLQNLIDSALSPAEGPQRRLLDSLRVFPWGIPAFRITIDVLRRAGRYETARDVAARAFSLYPASAWARTQVQEIERAIEAQRPKTGDASAGSRNQLSALGGTPLVSQD